MLGNGAAPSRARVKNMSESFVSVGSTPASVWSWEMTSWTAFSLMLTETVGAGIAEDGEATVCQRLVQWHPVAMALHALLAECSVLLRPRPRVQLSSIGRR